MSNVLITIKIKVLLIEYYLLEYTAAKGDFDLTIPVRSLELSFSEPPPTTLQMYRLFLCEQLNVFFGLLLKKKKGNFFKVIKVMHISLQKIQMNIIEGHKNNHLFSAPEMITISNILLYVLQAFWRGGGDSVYGLMVLKIILNLFIYLF